MASSKSGSPPMTSSPKSRGPTTLKKVVGAVTAMKDRKGASAQAIRKYIMADSTNVAPARMKAMIRRALADGLKSGVLVRPKGSTSSGSIGRFRVGKEPKPKKPKMEKAKKAKKPKKTKKAKKAKKPKTMKTKKVKKPKAKKAKIPKAKKSAKKVTKARPKVKKPKMVAKKASKKAKK